MSEPPVAVCPNCRRPEANSAVRVCPNCGATLPAPGVPTPPPVVGGQAQAQQPWTFTPDAPPGQAQRERNNPLRTIGGLIGCLVIAAILVILGLLALCGVIPTP